MKGKLTLVVIPTTYPDKPQKPVGKCYMHDNFYYQQRADDVLFVNTKNNLICAHEVGFLEGTNYQEISILEFSIALNTTVFNLNILNGEYKRI